jgi:anthranilate phosphoribosyltransferase
VDTEATAKAAADAGMAALQGEQGATYDALVYGAAMILWHLRRYDNVVDAARRVRKVLDSGDAVKRMR